jgi:hypothetical protein
LRVWAHVISNWIRNIGIDDFAQLPYLPNPKPSAAVRSFVGKSPDTDSDATRLKRNIVPVVQATRCRSNPIETYTCMPWC